MKKAQIPTFIFIWFIVMHGRSQHLDKIWQAVEQGDEVTAVKLLETSEDNSTTPNEFYQMLHLLAGKKEFPGLQAEALFKLGIWFQEKKNLDSAYAYFNQSLTLNEEIYNRDGLAKCLYRSSRIKALQGDFEEARVQAVRGLYLSRDIGNKKLEYRVGNIVSWSFFSSMYDFEAILEHEGNQARLAKELGDEAAIAAVSSNLAYDHTVSGKVQLDSLKSLMNHANNYYASAEGHNGRWYTLMNLTWLYRLSGQYESAADFAEKSLAQAEKIDDRHAIIEASVQYGETLLAMDKVEEAGKYYQLGASARGDGKDRDGYVFDVYYAHYLSATGQVNKAIRLLEEAVLFLATSEVFYEMHGRAILAQLYFSMGEVEKAKAQIEVFKNPRSEYISFESRCLLACTQSRILAYEGQMAKARTLLRAYLKHAESISAGHLAGYIVQTMKDLF